MGSHTSRYDKSESLLVQAERYLAGGVGSSFRRNEKPCPLYFERGHGPHVWDVDGNRYIDFVLGQGPLLLGHCHPDWVRAMAEQLQIGQIYAGQCELEIELGRRIQAVVPNAELMCFSNSSSEMVQLALRVARACTGRLRWVKMEGHYHGWMDNVLASVHPVPEQAGDPEHPNVMLESAGQHPAAAQDILISHYNDLNHLERLFSEHPDQIAAVLMEPVMCNSGCIVPQAGYLEGVRGLCKRHDALFIFDETITGFRLAPGGAAERFGVTPDLAIFGKGLGGGMPISCLTGPSSLLGSVANGQVFHAGTFNTNLLGLRAALTTLQVLTANDGEVYQRWEVLGEKLRAGLRERAATCGVNLVVSGVSQVTYTGFSDKPTMETYRDCWHIDEAKLERWCVLLKERGVRIIPRGIWYLSAAHTEAEIDEALAAADEVLETMAKEPQ